MRIKGTWFTDYVKVIRANKHRKAEFDNYLKPEDWQLVETKILPSQWYPLETYKRIGEAIFRVIAGSSLEMTFIFGQQILKELLKTYKNMLVVGDPAASVAKLVHLHDNFFKNIQSKTEIVEKDEHHLVIKFILAPQDMIDKMSEPFAWQLAGKMVELANQACGRQVKYQVAKNKRDFDITISW